MTLCEEKPAGFWQSGAPAPLCFTHTLYPWLLISLALLSLPISPAAALDWRPIPGGRYAELTLPKSGKTGLTSIPPETTGIFFTNSLAESRGLTNQVYLNGSGLACGDIDGDGWCDIYFCGLDGPNKLYRNLGNWKFQDITDAAGVACPNLDCTGAVFADIDGDGDLDLIVNSLGGGTHVFFNDGHGKFRAIDRLAIRQTSYVAQVASLLSSQFAICDSRT